MKTAVLAFAIFLGVYAWVAVIARRMNIRLKATDHDRGASSRRTSRRHFFGFFLTYFALLIAGMVLIGLSSGHGANWVAGLILVLAAIVFRFAGGWLTRRGHSRALSDEADHQDMPIATWSNKQDGVTVWSKTYRGSPRGKSHPGSAD